MKNFEEMQNSIELAFEGKVSLDDSKIHEAIEAVIEHLDQGTLRVASPLGAGKWETNEWIKKAILLYFRIRKVALIEAGQLTYLDKIPLKNWTGKEGVRVVP